MHSQLSTARLPTQRFPHQSLKIGGRIFTRLQPVGPKNLDATTPVCSHQVLDVPPGRLGSFPVLYNQTDPERQVGLFLSKQGLSFDRLATQFGLLLRDFGVGHRRGGGQTSRLVAEGKAQRLLQLAVEGIGCFGWPESCCATGRVTEQGAEVSSCQAGISGKYPSPHLKYR